MDSSASEDGCFLTLDDRITIKTSTLGIILKCTWRRIHDRKRMCNNWQVWQRDTAKATQCTPPPPRLALHVPQPLHCPSTFFNHLFKFSAIFGQTCLLSQTPRLTYQGDSLHLVSFEKFSLQFKNVGYDRLLSFFIWHFEGNANFFDFVKKNATNRLHRKNWGYEILQVIG